MPSSGHGLAYGNQALQAQAEPAWLGLGRVLLLLIKMIIAVFEDGILKPLQKLNLTTRQVVRLVILTPRPQEWKARLPTEAKKEKLPAISWKDFFATKLKWQKEGPLDLSEVSINALWL